MAQDTQKQAEPDAGAEGRRGPGRPKGSKNKPASEDGAHIAEPKDVTARARVAVAQLETGQDALGDFRASMEFELEELHKQLDKLQESVRVAGVTQAAGAGDVPTARELMAELKRLTAAEQRKDEHVEQWTRVLVELSGSDRRRYWRIMRVLSRYCRNDRVRHSKGKRAASWAWGWWQLGLLAVTIGMTLYGAMRFIVE